MAYEYKKSDIEKMQNDAIKRVMDMQARSKYNDLPDDGKHNNDKSKLNDDNGKKPNNSTNNSTAGSNKKSTGQGNTLSSMLSKIGGGTSPDGKKSGFGSSLLKMLNFKDLSLDKDKSIILMVLILLASEDADELLLLALIYIML